MGSGWIDHWLSTSGHGSMGGMIHVVGSGGVPGQTSISRTPLPTWKCYTSLLNLP